MSQRILALELSGERVRAAVAKRTYKSFELAGVYEQERAGDEANLSGALRRVVIAAGPPTLVISSLPGEFVAKRLLALPFTDRRRLDQVVAYALEEHLPFAVDDAVVAFARVGRELDHTLVIAAAARRDSVRQHLELLAQAGLDPKTVTLSTLALAEILTRTRNGLGAARLVVDIDSACTSMVLVDAAGTPRAMRTVGHGLDLNGNGGPSARATQAIFAAARQTILAHDETGRPELIVAGAAADSPAMCEQVARALQTPVRDLADFDYFPMIRGEGRMPRRFAGCVAMLHAESPSDPLELINFRRGEFAFHGRTGRIEPLRLTAWLVAAAVVAVLLRFSLGLAVNARHLHHLNRQVALATAPALGHVAPANARQALHAKLAEMENKLRLLGGSPERGSPLEVLLALSRAIPPRLPIQVDSLQIDDRGMKLEGEADSFATVDQVKRALERNPRFGAIRVDHAAAGADAGKVDFNLTASLAD